MAPATRLLVLLLAKIACCGGLALDRPAAGAIGVWLLEGTAVGLVGAALIGLIAAIILRSPKGSQGIDCPPDPK